MNSVLFFEAKDVVLAQNVWFFDGARRKSGLELWFCIFNAKLFLLNFYDYVKSE